MTLYQFAVWLMFPAVVGAAHADPCSALKKQTIAATEIGMPTRGAHVTSARLKHSHDAAYCEVQGEITSVDPTARPILFQVNLPEAWNGKAVHYGGGVFNGSRKYSNGVGHPEMGVWSKRTPLESGYATFGSDSGHHHTYWFLPDVANLLRSDFGANEEERKNFAGDQLKKTHDVAVAIMSARYASAPKRMFFLGGSTGGREALKVVENWPWDYDGVMATYAAWNQIESDLAFIRTSQALYSKSSDGQAGFLPKSKTKLLFQSVLNACDAKDGLKDGIVSNPAACHFDPRPMRCTDGHDGKLCFSDGQLRTIDVYATPQRSNFAVAHGMDMQPGYNVLSGADLTGTQGFFKHPMTHPIIFLNSFQYFIGVGVLRNFLTHDPHFDALTFDVKSGGPNGKWVAELQKQSGELDASAADLSAYANRGGKLLLVHGTEDTTIPTESSALYYKRIVAAMGQERADAFLRLYLIPGYGHGTGRFKAAFDALSVLDAWVDGHAPGTLIAVDQDKKNAARTRPMCAWPQWPKYMRGDSTQAASFSCVNE